MHMDPECATTISQPGAQQPNLVYVCIFMGEMLPCEAETVVCLLDNARKVFN